MCERIEVQPLKGTGQDFVAERSREQCNLGVADHSRQWSQRDWRSCLGLTMSQTPPGKAPLWLSKS